MGGTSPYWENGDNKNIDLMELLGGLNELIYKKCFKKLLVHSNIVQELAMVITIFLAT